jgi:hypothetical protein
MKPTMYTIRQTAAEAGVSIHFVRGLCKSSKIVFVKAGNKTLVNYEKFLEFLNNGEIPVAETNDNTGSIRAVT